MAQDLNEVGSEEKHFMSAHYKTVAEGLGAMPAPIARRGHGTRHARHPAGHGALSKGEEPEMAAVPECARALSRVIPG